MLIRALTEERLHNNSSHQGGKEAFERKLDLLLTSLAVDLSPPQCDQIGQFIGLWASFQSLWQQLVCPNLPHS